MHWNEIWIERNKLESQNQINEYLTFKLVRRIFD